MMRIVDFNVNSYRVHQPRPEDISRNLVLELKQGNGADVYASINPYMAKKLAETILEKLADK